MTGEIKIEELPMHELRKRVSAAGIKMKGNSKKVDYIEALNTGETNIEVREIKRMHHLEDTKTEKSIPLLPENFAVIIASKYPKLMYEIDEVSNCINFMSRIPGDRSVIPHCVNIDNPERLIYKAAAEAAGGRASGHINIEPGNDVQAARIDQEKRDRKAIEAEIRAEIANESGTT